MNTSREDLSLLCDFYELTMSNGYILGGMKDKICYFDVFFRRVPDNGGYAIAAGLEQIARYLSSLNFRHKDIEYLRKRGEMSEKFLSYLENFKFSCDVWAVPEGTPIFPGEPVIIVRGPAIEAQLIETMILLCFNHQSLIATKAARIVRAAKGSQVMEFGARRAHGADAALFGARAAYIGGAHSTSCTLAESRFGIPAVGTMAHSWIQMFDSEYEAFSEYAKIYPDKCTLLVDTYDVLQSGLPNAIRVFNEVLSPMGKRPSGIRIDSGDIAYLSTKARRILDAAGYPDCKIVVSNSLDEYIIREALSQGACIDIFGVGECLITSRSEPVFGGVYKLAAVEDKNGNIVPKIKLSENVSKITTPHFKKLWRLYNKETGRAIADVIGCHDDVIDESKPFELFHPEHIWKRKVVDNFYARELLVKIFDKGRLCYDFPALSEVREYCRDELSKLWEETKRFDNPQEYYVDLTQKLWDVKRSMLIKKGI